MTPQEFSAKIKAKYTQYANVDDTELAQKFVAKYPVYASQVKFAQPEEPTKESVVEKVADFTGGKKIAQGLGQALANKEISKGIDETMKMQSDVQTNLIKKIQEVRATGGDTTRLVNALKTHTQSMEDYANSVGKQLNQKDLTTKQVLGDALQLGTTIVGAGTLSKGATLGEKALTTGLQKGIPTVASHATKGVGIVKGAVQGIKTGTIAGGAYGASSGVSSALKEDKSAGDIAMSGVTGGLTGAVTGAAVGGVVGGISGGIKGHAAKVAAKNESHALDLVMPKATESEKVKALAEGRVTEQGLLSGGKITPSKRDTQLAEVVKDVVSSKKTPIQNLNAIKSKVDDINTGVKAYVKANKVPFNSNQLKSQLNEGKEELNLIFASDKQAEKTYNAVVKEFMKHVETKDTSGLLDARQAFDKIPAIKKLLDSQGLGENAKREIVLTARDRANQYIASLLPQGNKYRDTLLRESKMIEVIGNIADKEVGRIGKSKLIELTQKYPVLKLIAAGLLGASSVGVGGAIIGSSD